MKSSAKNVKLASVDDLFSTEESRADASREKVVEIPLSELHPFKDHPFKVKDDEATIIMVDSNLQREELLPSERAFAYKMKLEAMKHQGERVDLTCSQVGNKFAGKKSSEILAEQVGQSKNQIFRFIRLTELIPPLLDMVDEKKIALSPAYELSFLKPEEQAQLVETMDYEQATPFSFPGPAHEEVQPGRAFDRRCDACHYV